MTFTGVTQSVGNGLTQKQYSYDALGALVDIVFNTAGQIVGQPSVVKTTSTASATGTASATSKATSSSAQATTTSSA